MVTVKFFEQSKLTELLSIVHVGRALEIVDGISLGFEPGPLIDAGKKARAPVGGCSFGKSPVERIRHHDEGGKVAAFAAQSVGDPGTNARESHAGLARVHHEEGRAVVVRFGVAGVDEGHLIDMLTEFGKD